MQWQFLLVCQTLSNVSWMLLSLFVALLYFIFVFCFLFCFPLFFPFISMHMARTRFQYIWLKSVKMRYVAKYLFPGNVAFDYGCIICCICVHLASHAWSAFYFVEHSVHIFGISFNFDSLVNMPFVDLRDQKRWRLCCCGYCCCCCFFILLIRNIMRFCCYEIHLCHCGIFP